MLPRLALSCCAILLTSCATVHGLRQAPANGQACHAEKPLASATTLKAMQNLQNRYASQPDIPPHTNEVLAHNIAHLTPFVKHAGVATRHLTVNIPAAEVEVVENGKVISRHRAVIGVKSRPTPPLHAQVTGITFHPYWTAPTSIVLKDILPKIRRQPGYLAREGFRLYTPDWEEVDPGQINWNTNEAAQYMFVQNPGPLNPMGHIRLDMPNGEAVYMHATSNPQLFGQNNPMHSSGCVRVENITDIATWLLQGTSGWDADRVSTAVESRRTRKVALTNPIPVFWVYVTSWATPDGEVCSANDVYGRYKGGKGSR